MCSSDLAKSGGSKRDTGAVMLLYQLGWDDFSIARERGMQRTTVFQWRKRHGLRANFKGGGHRNQRVAPGVDTVARRVRRAVGRSLPLDIAEDAVADLLLAILAGEVPLDRIEAEARKYGNRVLDRFASRYGPRSIDETIAGTDDLRMVDLIADERSSSWLEEMGATAW